MMSITQEPFVSIIVLNFNGQKYLETCLSSIFRSLYSEYEVILVDNKSTDGSFQEAMLKFSNESRIKFFSNMTNAGCAEGYNTGVRLANKKAKYFIFLNTDIVLDRKCIYNLVDAAENDKKIGVAQSKLFQLENPRFIDCLGGEVDTLGFAYLKNNGQNDSGTHMDSKLFYADGAVLLVRRSLINEIGLNGELFDLHFFSLNEDLDLSWRVQLGGYQVKFVPTAIAFHARGGTTAHTFVPFLVFHQTKNRYITLISNYELRNLVRYLPPLTFVELCAISVSIITYPARSIAKIKSFLWLVKNFKILVYRRQLVQKNRKVKDTYIISKMVKPRILRLHYVSLSKH